MGQPFKFGWRVPSGGYCWLRAQELTSELKKGARGIFLVPRNPLPGAATWRRYSLFQDDHTGRDINTGLFRTFKNTKPTEDDILAFANKYGDLGQTSPIRLNKLPDFPIEPVGGGVGPGVDPLKAIYPGERLEVWHKEIALMCQLVDLWDAVYENQREFLREHVRWKGDVAVSVEFPHLVGLVATQDYRPDRLKRMEAGDLITPALEFLREQVNKQAQNWGVTFRLAWVQGGRRQQRAGKQEELRLFLCPTNLIGALWLQFAHCIDGKRKYRVCAHCGRWFELGAELKASARFCDNACKQRQKRKRKNEARELAKRGMSTRKIAQRLETNIETVKGWVNQ